MTDQLLSLAVNYGSPVLALAAALTCVGVPIPSALLMMAAGALGASGDLWLPGVFGAALAGALAGDQAGFLAGRHAGAGLLRRLDGSPRAHSLLDRARAFVRQRGVLAVFVTRWLLSALGPYVNLIAGAAGMPWLRFSLAMLAGELLWVGLHVGLGAVFSAYIQQIADIASSASLLLAALAVAGLLGRYLWKLAMTGERHHHP